MRFMKYFAVCFLVNNTATAQQIPYIDSRDAILNGVDLYKKEEYKKAIEEFAKVHECDTNYALAVYETILAYQADTNFRMAKETALEALRLRWTNKREVTLALAASYDYLKQHDSSLYYYDKLASQYPNDNQPWYERGVLWFKQEQYDKAISFFQHSLLLNPVHFRSHYMLGMTYALQGRLTEAFIALEASLLVTQNADLAKQSITTLNNITEGIDEVVKLFKEKKEVYSHPLFDEIDELLNAKLALDKKYKLKMDLSDNIFRQSQMIMEKLAYNSSDSNFVMQYYVPMLTELYSKELFEGYMLLLFSGYNYENVNALAKKKTSEVDEAREIVFPYLSKIQSTRELSFTKRKTTEPLYHFYNNDNFYVVGKLIQKDDKKAYVGDVAFYNTSHTLLAKGHHNNEGNREGWWSTYYADGHLKSREFYKDGQSTDSAYQYFSTGILGKVQLRDNKGEITKEYVYNEAGWLNEVRSRVSGDKAVNEDTYFSNGNKQMSLTYDDGKLRDGAYTIYYKSGKKKSELSLQNGKYNGKYKLYHENGRISEDVNYEKGNMDGEYVAYYESGILKEKSGYSNGKAEGAYEEYYSDGKISEKGEYRKGVKTEIQKYNKDGKLYATFKCKTNGKPTIVKYTDEEGKTVYEGADNSGLVYYELYYAGGAKYADIRLNDNGNKEGLITVYYNTGAKSSEAYYKDGIAEGTSTYWYYDGKKMNEVNYTNGEADGYYTAWYGNGNVQREGWYKKDKRQGLWKYYHVNGKLRMEVYFLNDKYDGWYKEYNINGDVENKYLFDKDVSRGQVCYDTAGKLTDSVFFASNNGPVSVSHWLPSVGIKDLEYSIKNSATDGKCIKRYVTGKIREDNTYANGTKNGLCIEYYPNGINISKGEYKDHNRDGAWTFYDWFGNVEREGEYKEGNNEGKHKLYCAKQLIAEYNYKNGSKNGQQIYYSSNGKIAVVLFYDEGDIVGYSHEGKDGKLLPEIKIKKGAGKVVAYYANGTKSAELTVKDYLLKDAMMLYHTNGKLAEERHYNTMGLTGAYKRFNTDGSVYYECTYKDNECDGEERIYGSNGDVLMAVNYYYGVYHGPATITDETGKKTTFNYRYGQLIGTN